MTTSKKHKVPKKWLGAFSFGHRKAVKNSHVIDDDFAWDLYNKAMDGDKKAEEALDYLARFNNELHRNVMKKGDPDAIIANNDEMRKEIFRNYRGKYEDMFSQGFSEELPDESFDQKSEMKARKSPSSNHQEDVMIELMDAIKLLESTDDDNKQ